MKAPVVFVILFVVAACSTHPIKLKAKIGAITAAKILATKIGAAKIGAVKIGAAKIGAAVKAKKELLVKGADSVLTAKQHFVHVQANKINSALQWKKELISSKGPVIVAPIVQEIALVHSPPPVYVEPEFHLAPKPFTSYGPPLSLADTYGAPLHY